MIVVGHGRKPLELAIRCSIPKEVTKRVRFVETFCGIAIPSVENGLIWPVLHFRDVPGVSVSSVPANLNLARLAETKQSDAAALSAANEAELLLIQRICDGDKQGFYELV